MSYYPFVSIIIPTFKRAQLIGYALEGLTKQTYNNFEVLVILKPSGDKTPEVVNNYKNKLNIRLFNYTRKSGGCVTDQLNVGLKLASGDVIIFLDDDAVPAPDWLENHVKSYNVGVGGVSGNVIPSFLSGDVAVPVAGRSSEIIPEYHVSLFDVGRKLWSCPIDGQEDFLVYISKAGIVDYNLSMAQQANSKVTKSLLGMGANMSVLRKPLKDFSFPAWTYGVAWEQYLGWYLWKKGYVLLFNPNAKVNHLSHGQTLSRNLTDHNRMVLRQVETQLLFFRLYSSEPSLSVMHRLSWVIINLSLKVKHAQNLREVTDLLKSIFIANISGFQMLLSKKPA
ncbi:MAG: glycosyltransferase family 2 protein [Candidatus Bathyarchaeota archaeon]|nr:glycosyltransferase family 2 protein [Candidatus Bathyarchaeota archaeon]